MGRIGRRLSGLACALLLSCSGSGGAGDDEASEDGGGEGDGASSGEDSTTDGPGDRAAPEAPAVSALCGNGIPDPGEECDDGNRLNGDACDWTCRLGAGEPEDMVRDPAIDGADDIEPGTPPTPLEGPTYSLGDGRGRIVWAETSYAAFWMGGAMFDPDAAWFSEAQFRRFEVGGGTVGPGWRFVEPENAFGWVDLVWMGEVFALTWCGGGGDLMFVELDGDGKPFYPPVPIVPGVGACAPALVWDGEAYGVFWAAAQPDLGVAEPALRFVRIGRHAVRLGDVVEVLRNEGSGVFGPAAASSGGTHAVAFLDKSPGCGDIEATDACVRYMITGREGEVLRGATTLSVGGRMVQPGAAWGDDRFAITWFATRSEPYPLLVAHIGFLSAGGELLRPPKPLRGCGARMTDGCSGAYNSAIAYGRGGWTIVLEGSFGVDVLRTDLDGVTVDRVPLDAPLSGFDIAFDGAGFGVLSTRYAESATFFRVVFAP